MLTLDQDLTACADQVRQGDPDRFRATMAAPVAARPVLFALYAFNIEISRAPWVSAETMIAEMRLQWWQDVGAEIAGGGPVRRHFVATPLERMLKTGAGALIQDMAEARRWDIYRDPFEDEAALATYIDRTAGSLMWLAASSLGADAEDIVRDYAWAAGLAAYLVAIPELEARKRIPLPDGRPEAVSALARTGLARLNSARNRRRDVPAIARSALLPGWPAEGLLKLAAQHPARVAQGQLRLSEIRARTGFTYQALTGRW